MELENIKLLIEKIKKIITNNIFLVIFIIFSIIEGMFFSYAVPFGQVPDEMTHYRFIENEFGTDGFYSEIESVLWIDAGYDQLPGNSEEKVPNDNDNINNIRFHNKLKISDFNLKITCLRHVPAALGFYLGVILNLPIMTCTRMAELFSLVFFIVIGGLAIKITPIKKDIFVFCLLLPMCLQQCASVNYDAVLIPCSFLLTAYVFNLFYNNKEVFWKDIIIIAVLSFVLFVVKLPYALICLIICIIPLTNYKLYIGKKFDFSIIVKKFWPLICIVIILLGVLYVYTHRSNPEIKTMVSDFLNIPVFLKLLRNTYESFAYYHLKQLVGIFGWLDSEVGSLYVIIVFCMLTFMNIEKYEEVEKELKVHQRLFLLLIAGIIVLLIEMAMQSYTYEYWQMDRNVSLETYCDYLSSITIILGVQGRYWIPILPMILLSISGINERKNKIVYISIQIIYYILSFIYVAGILLNRYW